MSWVYLKAQTTSWKYSMVTHSRFFFSWTVPMWSWYKCATHDPTIALKINTRLSSPSGLPYSCVLLLSDQTKQNFKPNYSTRPLSTWLFTTQPVRSSQTCSACIFPLPTVYLDSRIKRMKAAKRTLVWTRWDANLRIGKGSLCLQCVLFYSA